MEENKIVWQADNLPSTAKLWVRQVKKLLLSLTKQVSSLALETSRSFKTFDTNLGIVTRNARTTEETINNLIGVVEVQAELIQNQVHPAGTNVTGNNFALTNNGWVTTATATITGPDWAGNAIVNASGILYVVSNSEFAPSPDIRILINGTASPIFNPPPGSAASAIPHMGTLPFTRVVTELEGGPITVQLQVRVATASQWFTGAANRTSSLSATVLFTRSPNDS